MDYQSYLLRLWGTRDGGGVIWRASLEIPGTRERYGFANLRDLFDFVQAQTELPSLQHGWQPPPGDEE